MKKIVLILALSLFLACNGSTGGVVPGGNGGGQFIYTPPADWEDGAYLYLYPDVAGSEKYKDNPLAHWFEWGELEERIWKPEGWESTQYLTNNSDVAGDVYFGTHPLEHWWRSGKDEGRTYLPLPLEWMPPQTLGLHLILQQTTKKEYFSVMRIPKGLLIGQYGLYEGGPEIHFFDGKLKSELHIPDVESVMKIIDPGDGLPLACTEHYGRIYKRTASGQWVKKYQQGQQPTLMLDMAVAKTGVYGVYNIYGSGNSGLVKSVDKGHTWSETKFTSMALFGLSSDGTYINMVGAHNLPGPQNVYPFMTNANGTVLCSAPDKKGLAWWGACGKDGVWNIGTWSKYSDGVDQPSYIYAWNGSKLTQVYQSNRPHIHAMEVHNGVRYAVASWDWDVSGKTAQLLSSVDGYKWNVLADIPSHIMGMSFGDGGVYLAGGKFREYGRVYFYKL